MVEGTNKILLHVLKRLCAPELGEDGEEGKEAKEILKQWPKHLEEAVRMLNGMLLPALGYTPKELLLGLVVNTRETLVEISTGREVTEKDVEVQMAYLEQQGLDEYNKMVKHAVGRKTAYGRRVLAKSGKKVEFKKRQLVQVHRNNLMMMMSTERKLVPRRVVGKEVNLYTLETLKGEAINGRFSARRLREFVPRKGTELEKKQAEFERKLEEEGSEEQDSKDSGTSEEEL